jgi:predicted regulator of Ras-like GTPase activity (Roadblock/LC7/MglB family)
MSIDSRPALRGLRRKDKEPGRPDYSEPEFASWAAKLDEFIPAEKAAPAKKAAAAAVDAAPAAAEEPQPERPGLDDVLTKLLSFDGALSAALVDSETGMILGKAGSGIDMDLAAAGASVILRARLASIKALGSDERIDDVLISLTSQVQIIHPLPSNPSIFTYLIGDKSKSSLAMARYKAAEADLQIQL